MSSSARRQGRLGTLALGLLALALTLALVVFSEAGYKASLSGLKLFIDVVLPSLLPFFLLSDLLMALGVVHFLGECFEPIMRPVFNVPGVGSFVFSMGLAAGYPMDAVLTAKFRRQNLCSRVEGERLLAFTNSADPLFIFGAVAVAMFHDPQLGAAIAFGHYLGALTVGLLFRFHGRGEVPGPGDTGSPRIGRRQGLLARAADAALDAHERDGRSLVRVLNDAIGDSARTLLTIAAFMMLFAVLLRVLEVTHGIAVLDVPMRLVLRLFGLPTSLTHAAVSGLFEIDLGSAAAAAAHAPLVAKVVVASAIIAWSGFSVHAQVLSVLSGTDLRMGPYYAARFLHAVIAGALTFVALGPGQGLLRSAFHHVPLPALALGSVPSSAGSLGFGMALDYGVTWALGSVAVLLLLAIGAVGVHGISRVRMLYVSWHS